jgi:hypothetical protein
MPINAKLGKFITLENILDPAGSKDNEKMPKKAKSILK